MKRLLLFLTAILLSLGCIAQTLNSPEQKKKKERVVELYGEVYDSFTKAKIGAHITLMNADSTVIDTTTCWSWRTASFYRFKIPAKQQKLIVKGSLDGYEDAYLDYELHYLARNNYFELPRLFMKKKPSQDIWREDSLGGVVVRGTKVKMAYKGDTIVYDASAFNLPEGSMLDGLIRQLPGAELKANGDIYINGKKVDYLTLNGKDFFKGNNQVVLDNLPYYTIQNLNVYHRDTKRSQLAGQQLERKEYIVDVQLKREYRRGFMGNAEAGAGLALPRGEGNKDMRYLGRLFGLFYTDHSRYSLFGNLNNINEFEEPGSDGDWSPSNMPQGQRTTRQTGFDISTEDADKNIENQGSVRARWNDNHTETRTTRETFANSGSVFNGLWSDNRQNDFNLHVRDELKLHKPFSLFAVFNFDASSNKETKASMDSTYRQSIVNQTSRHGLTKTKTIQASGELTYYKKMAWGDLLDVRLNGSLEYNKPADSFSRQHTRYAEFPNDDDLLERYADTHTSNYKWGASARYHFSLPHKWYITPGIGYEQQRDDNHNLNYLLNLLGDLQPHELGWLPSTNDSLKMAQDWLNTDVNQLLTRTYSASLGFSKSTDDYYISLNLPYSRIAERLHFDDGWLDTISVRHSNEFAPEFNFFFWKGGMKYIHYDMKVNRPDLASLLPCDETLDPLIWRINNPDLKNHTRHNLQASFTHNIDSMKRSFTVGMNLRLERNNWGTQTFYDTETGSYTYINDNVNGNWGAKVNGSITLPLDKKRRLLLTEQVDATFDNSVDFDIMYLPSDSIPDDLDQLINPPLSTVRNWLLHNHLQLQYQLGDLSATVSGNFTWRNASGNRTNFVTLNAFDFDYGTSLIYTIPWVKLSLATDLRMYSRRGYYSDLMNDNHLVWNAQLSRSFLNNSLTAKIQAFDLLHQLSSTQYSVNAQGRTETWNNCIPRYVMLTVQYNFTKSPKKKG